MYVNGRDLLLELCNPNLLRRSSTSTTNAPNGEALCTLCSWSTLPHHIDSAERLIVGVIVEMSKANP